MKDPLIKTAINTENVFRFWRAIEALAPQNIDKANERDMLNPVYKTGAGGMLPRMPRNTDAKRLNRVSRGVIPLRPGFIISTLLPVCLRIRLVLMKR